MKKQELKNTLAARHEAFMKGRTSAWKRGVWEYAFELLENLPNEIPDENFDLKKHLLNGAENWFQYSESGNSLIYDYDIAERLCTPSELKRIKGGKKYPNATETWLDVQTRALHQAYVKVKFAYTETNLVRKMQETQRTAG